MTLPASRKCVSGARAGCGPDHDDDELSDTVSEKGWYPRVSRVWSVLLAPDLAHNNTTPILNLSK